MICFVCKNVIFDDEPKELFSCDGDFIHKKCAKDKDEAINFINNMTDEQFEKYLLGIN